MAFTSGNSIADLQILLANKSSEMDAFKAAFDAFAAHWKILDPHAFTFAASDWQALQDRFSHAKLLAQGEIALSYLNPMPASTITAQSWDGVIAALQKKDGVVSQGDLQDLWIRLQNAQKQPIASKPLIQPTEAGAKAAGYATPTDWTLKGYQLADSTIKSGEAGVKSAKDAALSHPWWMIGMGGVALLAIGGGLLVFAVPFLLPLIQAQGAVKKLGSGFTRTVGMRREDTIFAAPVTQRVAPKTVRMKAERFDRRVNIPPTERMPVTEAEWEPLTEHETHTEREPETERHSEYAPSTVRPRTERVRTLRSVYSSHRKTLRSV